LVVQPHAARSAAGTTRYAARQCSGVRQLRLNNLHVAPEQGVKRALKPGGRFVADFGGQGNALSVRVALTAVLAEVGIDASAGNPW